MPYHYDQFAKQIGRRALDRSGATVAHAEIAPEVQYADLQHEPDPTRSAERDQLGLLGQISSVACLIEVYSGAPDGDELRACLGKHIAFWRQRTRKAHRDEEPMAHPFLWVITAGVPTTLLSELSLHAAPGWLKGCTCSEAAFSGPGSWLPASYRKSARRCLSGSWRPGRCSPPPVPSYSTSRPTHLSVLLPSGTW
ncbi:MAG TPA: hypothetical protein VHT91_00930 [Kofleriaceae bacterium]|nr:hypothetical protein [Kofleriaceae bacterium]